MNNLFPGTKGLPTVSVIMPAWNAAPFIHEAASSVLTQSFSDLELIVVNDGSTDWDYQQLAQLDQRVVVVDLPRGGVSRARNAGLQRARGRYIAFIDADDLWVPGKLQVQVEYLERHPDVAIVFGNVRRWYPDASGRFPDVRSHFPSLSELDVLDETRKGWMYTRILMGDTLGMITPVLRREVYEMVGGFNVGMERAEDYEYWLRCSRHFRMQAFQAVMAIYRMHSSSTMHRVVVKNDLAELLTRSRTEWGLADPDGHRLSATSFRRRVGRAHFDHGYVHYRSGDPVVALKAFCRSLLAGKFMFKSSVYCVLSLLKAGTRSLSVSR